MNYFNSIIDLTDKNILSALLAKGRSTFAELATQVGLTAPTVHDRVKKLERSGVIEGYTAIINPSSLGYYITGIVNIVTEASVVSKLYEQQLSKISEIQRCFSVAGDETYIAIVLTQTPETFEVILNQIRAIPGTLTTQSSVVLSTPISRHTLPQIKGIRAFSSDTNDSKPASIADSEQSQQD